MENKTAKQIFAHNLMREMKDANIDRRHICDKLDIKYNTFCDWCQPGHPSYPKIETIQRISELLDCDYTDLIDEIDFNSKQYQRKFICKKHDFINVYDRIPAGTSVSNINDLTPIDCDILPSSLSKTNDKYFAIKIINDSMAPIYLPGDLITFVANDSISSGDTCCVSVGSSDATIKVINIKDDGIVLSPINYDNASQVKPEYYSSDDIKNLPITILGSAVGFKRYFNK